MSKKALEKAMDFMENEKQFHLGFLPTEQSSPLTRNLDREFAKSYEAGVRNLQSVDRNVLEMAEKIFVSEEFRKLTDAGEQVIRNGGKLVFSGCGATGRLSILLETMWRESCPEYAGLVKSIMTGGDFALVKSVESFEDHAVFGARQVQDLGMRPDDLLVAITEGGETSSVLGTVAGFTAAGGKAFLLFNNPAQLLKEHLERSREAIENPAVRWRLPVPPGCRQRLANSSSPLPHWKQRHGNFMVPVMLLILFPVSAICLTHWKAM